MEMIAKLTLQDVQQRVQWKLPCAAIEPEQPGVQPRPQTPPTRADFARGDEVSFADRHLLGRKACRAGAEIVAASTSITPAVPAR